MIDGLRHENTTLTAKLNELDERSSLNDKRAKDATTVKLTQVSLTEQLSSLKSRLNLLDQQLKESQAVSTRLVHCFGSSSLYLMEAPHLKLVSIYPVLLSILR